MQCPMCNLSEEHQVPDTTEPDKTKCKGCGTTFFDRSK